ncbi:chaperone protein dnaJ 20, chloroplastic-like [Quillaja saponaria]|uniref:Chaperone protein dnaJ 20, chloroplastic-like n=1 Tax=Quillaja saponaria TaxID=32244 RepID=A0AAD7M1F1_QUISA|nr:chaperone protein dnaJ 20, chloroplastic-like [Quillaja saponaria]
MAISLSSSLSNSKPFHCLTFSNKRQIKPQIVSCRAYTKLAGENDTTSTTNPSNFYNMLSLSSRNVTMEEIKSAYRSLALRHHPDVCHPSKKEESTRMFVQLNDAYKTLMNPVLREEYDCELLGLRSQKKMNVDGEICRRRWQEQIVELKRRTNSRKAQKGTWGSRMRAKNIEKQ